MKRILMVAFHYPPFHGGSGIHRTLKFSQYLPEHGWEPIILSASPRAYPQIGNERLREIPPATPVVRAFALDTTRHLSFGGSYPRILALPDRWMSWWLGAVPAGIRLICKYKPDVIWSTFPIATAHWIAYSLHRFTGIRWVADFRDSMTEENYPADPVVKKAYDRIERATVNYCSRAVFTTPGALSMYSDRYPEVPESRWAVIANGFDEEDFAAAEKSVASTPRSFGGITLLHSGLIYPSERDPRPFFDALAELRGTGAVTPTELKIVLRGSGNEEYFQRHLEDRGIQDIVRLEPPVPYGQALAETLVADGLLILQASNCNHQIPAKIYEYMRAKRPIFAMTDRTGDTANVLAEAGIDTIVPLDSKEEIERGLLSFLGLLRERMCPLANDAEIARHTRRHRTKELAELLGSL